MRKRYLPKGRGGPQKIVWTRRERNKVKKGNQQKKHKRKKKKKKEGKGPSKGEKPRNK